MNDIIKQDALEVFNKGIAVIGEKLKTLELDAQKIQTIESAEDSTKTTEILRILRAAIKEVKNHNLNWTKPFRDMVSFINSQVNTRLSSAQTEERRLTQLLGKWNAEQQRRYQEELEAKQREEERRRKIQEAHKAAGHEVKETTTPVSEPVPVKLRGVPKTRKDIDFEITDFYKIPQNYLKVGWQENAVDRLLIKKMLRQGETIPGIKVIEKTTVVT